MDAANSIPIFIENIRWLFIMKIVFQIAIFYGVISIAEKLVIWLRRRGHDKNNTSVIWLHLIKIVFVIHLILSVFNELNLNVKTLESVISWFFTISILLLNRNFFSNIVYGIWFLFDKSFRIGSTIEFAKTSGVIKEINLINFAIETNAGDKIYIPYNKVYKQEHKVNHVRSGYFLEVKVKVPETVDTAIVHNLCLLNPYRKENGKVEIIKVTEDSELYLIARYYTWSNSVVIQSKELFLSNLYTYLNTLEVQ